MTKKRVVLFCLVGTCLLCRPGLVQAQSEALAYDQTRAEMYSAMLRYGNGENYSMISGSLGPLNDTMATIKSRFGVDIASQMDGAVKSGNKERVLLALCKLIYYDIKNTFHTIQSVDGRSPGEVRSLLKTAVANYSALSPEVRRTHKEADQRIAKLFEWAIYLVPSESSASFTQIKGTGIDAKCMNKLKKLMGLIQEECVKVFPAIEASGSHNSSRLTTAQIRTCSVGQMAFQRLGRRSWIS